MKRNVYIINKYIHVTYVLNVMLVYYTYSHTFIHLRCGKNTHVIFLLLNTVIEGMKPL